MTCVVSKDSSRVLATLPDSVDSLALLPNGELACGVLDSDNIYVLNSTTGKIIRIMRGHTGAVLCLIVLPTGELVSGSADTTIKMWNVSSGKLIRTLTGDTNNVNKLVVLPSGLLASASDDSSVSIWNTTTGENVIILFGSKSEVTSLAAVLPNGDVADGSIEPKIFVWNATSGYLKLTISNTYFFDSLAALSNGNLASGLDNGPINIWDLKTTKLVRELIGHTDSVRDLLLLPGDRLASASRDATIRI